MLILPLFATYLELLNGEENGLQSTERFHNEYNNEYDKNGNLVELKVEKYDNGVLIDTFEEEPLQQNTINIKIGKVYGFTPYKPKEIFASKRY